MRGARLILPLPRPKYRGRQKVVVRSRLAAACEIQTIAWELQRRERASKGKCAKIRPSNLGVIVLKM